MTLWLGPLSVRTFRTLEDRLRAGQASYQVAPRVFDERFPHMVLYVNDIDSAATRWKGVFLAGTDKGVSRLTLAEEAIVIPDRSEGKLELHLRNGSVHEFSVERSRPLFAVSAFGERDLPVDSQDHRRRAHLRAGNSGTHHERAYGKNDIRDATPASKCSGAFPFPLPAFRSLFWPCRLERVLAAAAAPPDF